MSDFANCVVAETRLWLDVRRQILLYICLWLLLDFNIIRLDFAKQIGATIYNTNSRATQAGEVHLVFKIDDLELYFDGLVTKDRSV